MQDKDTPKFIKLALMGAIGYVILPFDLVPDVFAGFGWLDDAAVVAAALHLAGTYVKPEHREKVRRMFPFLKSSWVTGAWLIKGLSHEDSPFIVCISDFSFDKHRSSS